MERKNKQSSFLSFIRKNAKDIASLEKEQAIRKKEFRKEWGKWGEVEKRARIVDFLYRDLSRIDSIFAQLYQGAIREVATSQNVSSTTTKSFEADIKLAKGKQEGSTSDSDTIQKRIDPHDQRIIELLDALQLTPYHGDFSDLHNGQLILLQGSMFIRNYSAFYNIVPLLPEIMAQQSNASSKERKKQKDELKQIVNILKMIPFGLEVELITKYRQSVIGPLKDNCLEDNHNDLLRIYGNHIPGKWYILGIFSSSVKTLEKAKQVNDLRRSLDDFGNVVREMYGSGQNALTPILIYRELIHKLYKNQ